MATTRDEVLSALISAGLTSVEAEDELQQRESAARQAIASAPEETRDVARRQARADLLSETPRYVLPRASLYEEPAIVISAPTIPSPKAPVAKSPSVMGDFIGFATGYVRWTFGGGFFRRAIGLAGPLLVVAVLIGAVSGHSKKSDDVGSSQAVGADIPVSAKSTSTPKVVNTPDPASLSGTQRFEACDIAKKFVKDSLKAPSTAKFQDCSAVIRDGDNYHVQGTVDAENSFGAKLRNFYDVKFIKVSTDSKGNDSFRLTSPVVLQSP